MTPEKKPIFHYENGVPIFDSQRIDDLEREQEEAKQRDAKYKDTQLKINKGVMVYTGVLAACSILTGGISLWQTHITSQTVTEMQSTREQTKRDNATAIVAQQHVAETALNASQSNFQKSIDTAGTQFRQTLEQMKGQTRVEQEAANAAKSAADTARVALFASQRPWFGVSEVEVLQYEPTDPTKPMRFQISLKNTGGTPAREVNSFGLVAAYPFGTDGPSDEDWRRLMSYFGSSKERYVAPPAATRKILVDSSKKSGEGIDFWSAYRQAVLNRSLFLYYFGQLTYLGQGGELHTTKYCVWLADPDHKQFAFCSRGNEMD